MSLFKIIIFAFSLVGASILVSSCGTVSPTSSDNQKGFGGGNSAGRGGAGAGGGGR